MQLVQDDEQVQIVPIVTFPIIFGVCKNILLMVATNVL